MVFVGRRARVVFHNDVEGFCLFVRIINHVGLPESDHAAVFDGPLARDVGFDHFNVNVHFKTDLVVLFYDIYFLAELRRMNVKKVLRVPETDRNHVRVIAVNHADPTDLSLFEYRLYFRPFSYLLVMSSHFAYPSANSLCSVVGISALLR